MSAIHYSSTGSVGFINYTRYCSADIISLLDFIEAQVPAADRCGQKITVSPRYGATTSPGEAPVLIIKSFTGSPKYKYVTESGKSRRTQRLLLAATRWKFPNEVRVLPPDKVYENPVEALTAVVDGTPQLPAQMVDELGIRLLECYETWAYRSGRGKALPPDFSGLSLHIRAKTDSRAPKRSRRVVALENAMKAYSEIEWRSKTAKNSLESLEQTFIRMENAAEKAKIPCSVRNEIIACFTALEQAKLAADKFIQSVRQEV